MFPHFLSPARQTCEHQQRDLETRPGRGSRAARDCLHFPLCGDEGSRPLSPDSAPGFLCFHLEMVWDWGQYWETWLPGPGSLQQQVTAALMQLLAMVA